MTVANLFAQHRAGKVSKEKFIYEVRRDAQLPFISNLTSYEDAIKILKQKGMIKEAVMYGGSDGDYDQNQEDEKETERAYDDGYAAFKAGDKKEAEKLYKKARDLGARLAWDETELPPYDQIKKSKSPKRLVKKAGKYDLSQRDIPGLDKTQIKTLETWINLINADLNWWNTQYPNYSGNPSILMGDISKAFNLSIDDFVKKYEHDNPISVANLVKKQISGKLVKENSDYEPIQRREPVDFVDDTDDFDTDYLEFTDGDTVVSLHKEDGKWKEGGVIEGEKPYGWGSKTYMSYLTPKQIASYLSKDYGGKWTSYEGLEEADEPAQASEEIKNNINELLRLQEQLDAATAAYEKSIESLVSRKDALVKSVFDSEDVKKVEGAKELKILVDGLVAVVTNPSTRKNLSYKTFSELLEAELKRVAPELTDTINDLREGSKELSTVKGKLAIGGKKIYEEEADDLMSSIKRSKLAVAHAIKAFRGQSLSEASFKVDKEYTHFAIRKADDKIVTGWDYKGVDNKDIRDSVKKDLNAMGLKLSDYAVVTTAALKKRGIDPFNWDNWKKEENKPKSIIKEQQDLYHQIDKLNPILVKKAANMELAKLPMINAEIYQKITEKVVKKLQKDPRAYDEVLVSNAKEIHKVDEKLKMTQVKSELKDPHNQMKSPKGLEKPKTNVKASKTENKKGKPKGVKEMKGSKKGHGGIKQMENPGTKETVLESLLSFMFKKKLNEDTHHEYTQGKKVKTPKGEGVIEGLIGDTATVAYKNGVKEDIQINALRHYEEEANKPVEEETPEIKKHEPTMDEKKDKVIQKVLEFLRKKKLKDESIDIETSNPSNPDSNALQTAKNLQRKGLNAKFVRPVPGAPK